MELNIYSAPTLQKHLPALLESKNYKDFYKVALTEKAYNKYINSVLDHEKRISKTSWVVTALQVATLALIGIPVRHYYGERIDNYTGQSMGNVLIVCGILFFCMTIFFVISDLLMRRLVLRISSPDEEIIEMHKELEAVYAINLKTALDRYKATERTTYDLDCLTADMLLSLLQLDLPGTEDFDLSGTEKGTAIGYYLGAQMLYTEGKDLLAYADKLDAETDSSGNRFVKIDIHKDDNYYGWFFCLTNGTFGYTDSQGYGEVCRDGSTSETTRFTVPATPASILRDV